MEHGLDLSVSQKHYNWHIKQGKMSQAGALMAVYPGALWHGERLGPEDPFIAGAQIVVRCTFSTHAQALKPVDSPSSVKPKTL
eukprot:8817010-Karenia_brevis.AAC.1